KALHLLESGANVFLTGAAGTGKSFLLQQFLRGKDWDSYPILASTGTAAMLVNGRTFHSFFGLGIMEGGRDATVSRVLRNGRLHKRLQKAECVIIDEISMLSGETIATAEEIARNVRESVRPWGGLRIIAVGDFAQLPPVQRGGGAVDWGFTHDVWRESNFSPAFLETPVRTNEPLLLDALNNIREGNVSSSVIEFLQSRTVPPSDSFDGTRLFPHRATADRYNHQRLDMLPGRENIFPTSYEGRNVSVEQLKRQCPIAEELHIKIGALVMLRKNDTSFPYQYVNGTLGTVMALSNEALTLKLLSGKTIDIERTTFSLINGNGEEQASAYNFPVTLAWASTIHKAQGASIDSLMISLTRLWESGHAYVALSRARSVEGLFIEQWDERSIFIDPLVQDFYNVIRMEWEAISATLPDTNPNLSTETRSKPIKKKRAAKGGNHKKTLPLLEQKVPLDKISKQLEWKEDTIIGHIEKLLLEKVPIDIEYLRPEEYQFEQIAGAFYQHGMDTLKPIYDACNGEYSYSEVKLVKLFLEKEEGARF
ncbi:AAA family ATPase, partial [Candidatus Peregrinibacteria bacterium]|nr:AAA family ATPase [Candidatus Peregrinibacteria bacterium]